MKWSRTKDKDKAKVIVEKMKKPDITLREIEEKTWIPQSTADDILKKDLPEVRKSSEIIADIIEIDMQSIKNMAEITKKFTEQIKKKEELDRSDISVANTSVDSAFKRSQIYQNKATDRVEVLDAWMLDKVKNWEIDVKALANELQNFLLNDK